MKTIPILTGLLLASLLLVTGVHAKKDDDDKHGKKDRHEQGDRDEKRAEHGPGQTYREGRGFDDRQRTYVRNYYEEENRVGRCPPGLAKKHNGCMPPGQARRWVVGRPLPREVVYYSVPQPLVAQLGVPGPGYRYVRVASDILLIAVGTSMVVDAMKDLGR